MSLLRLKGDGIISLLKPLYENSSSPIRVVGTKALFSSAAYIQSFEGMSLEDSQALAMELYVYQTQEKFQYRHKWEKDMLVIWDNRSLLHSATGGFDGYDRLLHRVTIADTQW